MLLAEKITALTQLGNTPQFFLIPYKLFVKLLKLRRKVKVGKEGGGKLIWQIKKEKAVVDLLP